VFINSVLIICAIFFSFFISKKMTFRLNKLCKSINNFVESKFENQENIEIIETEDEIGKLINNYNILKNEIINKLNFFEEIVEQRTSEIKKQNNNIIASINYAKDIQEALLPNKNLISKHFADLFIFYKPKAIVSGDFYWFKHLEKKNISILAVADCTGHGVPGAFMSMLGMAFLNDIVNKKSVKNAGQVLDNLREAIVTNLKKSSSGRTISDGLDISLIVIFHNINTMQYSGANRCIFLTRNDEIFCIDGDKMPIGKYIKEVPNFKTNEIDLIDNDQIYLFTDGFADQFGATDKKKYLRKNLKNLIFKINKKNMNEQYDIFISEFDNWKQNLEQTDDVLLIGLKYKQTIVNYNFTPEKNDFKNILTKIISN